MRKTVLLMAALILLSFTASAQTQNTGEQVKPGMKPGDMFYWLENVVETAEVQIAGMIGGPDLKAKAIANNAEERLAEVRALEKQNKTEKASELRQKYSQQINKSRGLAEKTKDPKLKRKLDNITRKNQKVLENIKKITPDQAQKGLEKAINNSRKNSQTPGNSKVAPRKENVTAGKPEEMKKLKKINKTVNKSEPQEMANTTGKDLNKTVQDRLDRPNRTANETGNSTRDLSADRGDKKSDKDVTSSEEKSGDSSVMDSDEADVENGVEEAGSGTGLP